jgi:hypothetical protein
VIELVLAGLLVAMVAWHFFTEGRWARERSRLVNAIVARSAGEFVTLERAETPRRQKPAAEPERPQAIGL